MERGEETVEQRLDETGVEECPEEETLLPHTSEGRAGRAGPTVNIGEDDGKPSSEEISVLQQFVNIKFYVFIYGLAGCFVGACSSYLSGIITTMEKQFKTPSTHSGFIVVAYDVSTLVICLVLKCYGGRGHRPRWVALGVYVVVLSCLLSALPQLLYGPGDEALRLTLDVRNHNTTYKLADIETEQVLCLDSKRAKEFSTCDKDSGDSSPLLILLLAQLLGGIGGSIYFTLGVAYMDDNIKRSKAPVLMGFSFLLRILGPATGYALASATLSLYISPSLTPTIDNMDPRWLGAWWLGWLLLAACLAVLALPMFFFPNTMLREDPLRMQALERDNAGLVPAEESSSEPETTASTRDMIIMIKKLLKNTPLTLNTCANIFYLLGSVPFWIYLAKYIEIMYKRSASSADAITGVVGFTFSAVGTLSSGVLISKYKPRARFLAAWNILVGLVSALSIVGYSFLRCPLSDLQGTILASGQLLTNAECSVDCHCDYVPHSPVCSPDGRTFISPCHAGCRNVTVLPSGAKFFTDCACAAPPPTRNTSDPASHGDGSLVVTQGACPMECSVPFYIFLALMAVNKFIGATGRTSSLLISVRCVKEKEKTVSLVLSMVLVSLFAFLPSPILFGYLIDSTCLYWGNTCSGAGNCRIHNNELLSHLLNFTAAGFIAIGTLFDVAVWFRVKDLKIFDDELRIEMTPNVTEQIEAELKELL